MRDDFLTDARATYVAVNAGTLNWMLDRPRGHGVFLDSKVNSITLEDFPPAALWRGPITTYGWIQGRGLEALIAHAEFFENETPALAKRLHGAARPLYAALAQLYDRYDGAFFAYDGDLTPVIRDSAGRPVPQHLGTEYATYSDLFVLKGLIRAAGVYDPARQAHYLSRFAAVIAAIENGHFIMDEWRPLAPETLAGQSREFGPRMIAMGAAAMLRHLGLEKDAAFGDRFIDHILNHHMDGESGLLRDAENGARSNVGHAVEFAGFALEYLPRDADPGILSKLERITDASFKAGFCGPGMCLHVTVPEGRPASEYFPWWSLPEAIRAIAFTYGRSGRAERLVAWKAAHEAFFTNYWRSDPPIAFQTRDAGGPVDYVPATSDLDPGYHTGLSLLGAIEAIDARG